jgi:CubicO group peptidase (beta-lactamase class C family)
LILETSQEGNEIDSFPSFSFMGRLMLPLFLSTLVLSQAFPPIDQSIRDALAFWEVPGAAVVVVSKDKVVHLKGYGVRERNGPEVTPDTLFPLASCSKSFTSALLAQLVDERKLSWDDPVRKQLPWFHLSDKNADAMVVLRDLLSHRTGVGGHDLLWYRSPWGNEEIVRRTCLLPLAHPFRTEMEYQSAMYTALGLTAAKATGQSWEELLRERLFKPLGMKDVSLTTTEAAQVANRAVGYRVDKGGKLQAVPWYAMKTPNAAGSVNATASSLVPWLQLYLNQGKHRDQQIISEENLRETITPQIPIRLAGPGLAINPESQQISYGMGWVIQDYRGKLMVQHAGLIDGFRVHLTLLPKDGIALAILANREGTRFNLALSNTLVDRLLNLERRDWNKTLQEAVDEEETAKKLKAKQEELARRPGTMPSLPLKGFTGTYTNAVFGDATIGLDQDRLVWEWGNWKVPLNHFHFDIFRLDADNPHLDRTFLQFRVREGKVDAFQILGHIFVRKE